VQSDAISFGNTPISVFDSTNHAVEACARDLSTIIMQNVEERLSCRIAFCGGNAARLVLTQLTTVHHDFAGVDFYLADERCLPPGHLERNDELLIELLVNTNRLERSAVHSIPAELGPHEGATRYARIVQTFPHLDVVFLSIGEDGHVASIFPGHPSAESHETTVAVVDAPKPPFERVSLSVDTIRKSTHRLITAFGEEKSLVISRIHGGWDPPAVQVQPTRWYLDRAAIQGFRG